MKKKYNRTDIPDMSKSKMLTRVGYRKGTLIDNELTLSDIIAGGGQIHITAQEVRQMPSGIS